MNEQIEGPLITKTEHLAGEKHLDLNYRWGEAIRVRLGALGWRELQNISATIAANRLGHLEQTAEIVRASLAPALTPEIMDKLEVKSAALLQRAALALSLGEGSLKNALPAEMPAIPVPTDSRNVSGPNASLSSPDIRSSESKESPLPGLPSSTENSSAGGPEKINGHSLSPPLVQPEGKP